MQVAECSVHSQREPRVLSYITPKFSLYCLFTLFRSAGIIISKLHGIIHCNSNPFRVSYREKILATECQVPNGAAFEDSNNCCVPKIIHKELKTKLQKLKNSGKKSKQIDRMRHDCSLREAVLTKRSKSTSSPCERDKICRKRKNAHYLL